MSDMEKMEDALAPTILQAWASQCSNCSPDYVAGCGCAKNAARAACTAMLAHIESEGWQLVPKVATKEMCDAGESDALNDVIEAWNAMLAAAPKFGDDHG